MSVSSVALSAVSAQQAQTRTAIATEIVRQNYQAEANLANLIEQVAKSAPPPTSSGRLDISV